MFFPDHVGMLLQCIRVENMPVSVVQKMIIDDEWLSTDVDLCNRLLSKAAVGSCLGYRLPRDVMFAIGGWTDGSATALIEAYDYHANRWVSLTDMSGICPHAYHGMVVVGTRLYIIGRRRLINIQHPTHLRRL